MMPSPTFEYGIDTIALALMIVLLAGLMAMIVSRKTKFPYTPLLILFGILVGPILHLILPQTARIMFYYLRAFGLFIIMFAAGFEIHLHLLKKHRLTIALLDTLGLLITALVAGWFFQIVFHVPWSVGFLFGAIVSGTDPATLVPLFKEHKVDKDMETIIITESIFNGPLAIILTFVAFVFVMPEIPALEDLARFTPSASVYALAVVYFVYQIFASAVIGGIIAYLAYKAFDRFNIHKTPHSLILGLSLAFGGYVIGEAISASGFLVVTIIAIVLGNHEGLFHRKNRDVSEAVKSNAEFSDILSTLSIILVFVFLGASLSTSAAHLDSILYGTLVALFVVFVARPLATLVILPKTGVRKYLFIAFEGPKGAVAASMATLPIAIGALYNDANLIYWGEIILTSTLMTVFLSMILESAWMPFLKRKLLDKGSASADASTE